MKLHSINWLVSSAISTFKRFSPVILFAIGSCWFYRLYIHLPYEEKGNHHYYINLVLSCYLGMLLLMVVTIYSERNKFTPAKKVIGSFLAILLIAAYYYSLPDHFTMTSMTRFVLFFLGLHFLVAFVPFIRVGEINGFWQYNKILFLRILTAGLYSGVLYIGLFLALLAIEKLFGANIEWKTYADLGIFIFGIFNTWFFLAGFPADFGDLELKTEYPKGLKIFTQYILFSLITVYLVILYLYMFKIIFTAQWPYGWVSYLVLVFSIVGILSLLLIHPIRNEQNNKWILAFNRFFYFAICPLIVLLFLAIQRRIRDYGITELRYFVLILAIWLAFIAVYFLVSKKKNIKIIPVTLCILAFLSSFGPWGAFAVSINSQTRHLIKILEKNKLVKDHKIVRLNDTISIADAKEITSTVEYLINTEGYPSLQPYFSQNLDSLLKRDKSNDFSYSYAQTNKVLGLMNIAYTNQYEAEYNQRSYFNYHRNNDKAVISLTGFDYFINDYSAYTNKEHNSSSTYMLDKKDLLVSCGGDPFSLRIQSPNGLTLAFNLDSLTKSFKSKASNQFGSISTDSMMIQSQNEELSVKIIFRELNGEYVKDKVNINHLAADILVRFKKP